MNKNAAIGIFDSGVGGLTVSRAIQKLLPSEDIIYVADTGHAPYGEKSNNVIQSRSIEIADFLHDQKVKAIVVACNTATVSTIEMLRARYRIPIIGVEPGVKPAMETTRSGTVGILATSQTVQSQAVKSLIDRYGVNNKVLLEACVGWVEAIESGRLNEPATLEAIKSNVMPLLDQGADTLVLGCTHYAFFLPQINSLLHDLGYEDIHIVTTHDAVAKQVSRRLGEHRLLSNEESSHAKYFSSEVTENSQALFNMLLEDQIHLQPLNR